MMKPGRGKTSVPRLAFGGKAFYGKQVMHGFLQFLFLPERAVPHFNAPAIVDSGAKAEYTH